MRLVATNICYNDIEWLPYSLPSIYPIVDKIIIVEGAFEGWYDKPHSTDGTVKWIKNFIKKHDKANKIIFVQKENFWKSFEEKKEVWFEYLEDGDWVINFDSDEVYNPNEIKNIREHINKNPNASEFIPIYKHFFIDFYHIFRPSPIKQNKIVKELKKLWYWTGIHSKNKTINDIITWLPKRIIKSKDVRGNNLAVNVFAQRIFKYTEGSKYHHHMILTDRKGRNTVFHPYYEKRRIPLEKGYIYHFSGCRDEEYLKRKIEYDRTKYRLLSKKEAVNVAQIFLDLIRNVKNEKNLAKKLILKYDGPLPEIIKKHPKYKNKTDIFDDELDRWDNAPEYR